MNFYEINEPYYALIKAKDEIEATEKYIEIVAGREEEFEKIREEMNFVEKDYVIGKVAFCIDEDTGERLTSKELLNIIEKEEADVLLMDGSLF